MAAARDDLCVAALVFLQGRNHRPANTGRMSASARGQGAGGRVADALAHCDATARPAIVGAVERYRREGSWRNREAVIEAVTLTVVPVAGG